MQFRTTKYCTVLNKYRKVVSSRPGYYPLLNILGCATN